MDNSFIRWRVRRVFEFRELSVLIFEGVFRRKVINLFYFFGD